MLTIFILVMGQDWHIIERDYMLASGLKGTVSLVIAKAYFITIIIVGNIILLSLFTALLLRNFQKNLKREENFKKAKNRSRMIQKFS